MHKKHAFEPFFLKKKYLNSLNIKTLIDILFE